MLEADPTGGGQGRYQRQLLAAATAAVHRNTPDDPLHCSGGGRVATSSCDVICGKAIERPFRSTEIGRERKGGSGRCRLSTWTQRCFFFFTTTYQPSSCGGAADDTRVQTRVERHLLASFQCSVACGGGRGSRRMLAMNLLATWHAELSQRSTMTTLPFEVKERRAWGALFRA